MATLQDICVAAAINILSAFAFLVAFAILRLQPVNDRVYFPKWYLKGLRSSPKSSAALGRFVNLDFKMYMRFLNWMPAALKMPEPELIEHAGLDSAVYIRIYLLGWVYSLQFLWICISVFSIVHGTLILVTTLFFLLIMLSLFFASWYWDINQDFWKVLELQQIETHISTYYIHWYWADLVLCVCLNSWWVMHFKKTHINKWLCYYLLIFFFLLMDQLIWRLLFFFFFGSLKILFPITILTLVVLVPVNWTGKTLELAQFKNLTFSNIDKLSISNIPTGSKRWEMIWFHKHVYIQFRFLICIFFSYRLISFFRLFCKAV